MKKIVCLFIALVTVLSLVSCSKQKPEPIDYQVYYAGYYSLDGEQIKPEFPEGLTVKSYSEMNLTFSVSFFSDYFVREEAEKEKVHKIGDNEFVLPYKYTKTVEIGEKAKNNLGDYEYRDKYEFDGVSYFIEAEYNSKTGKLIYYSNYEAIGDYENKKFTFEMAQDSSKEFFESIYGSGTLDNYMVDTYLFHDVNDVTGEKQIRVDYRLNINGVETDEIIRFIYTKNGYLIAFVGYDYGKFKNVEEEITLEAIENAEKALKERFPDYYRFQEYKILRMDAESGACILEMAASNPNAKDKSSYPLYINVTSME